MWMTLMPSLRASWPQSSRDFGVPASTPVSPATLSSACFTKCDTRPGFAPCVSTAVGARAFSRAQRQRLLAQRVVGALGVRNGGVGVAARPRLDAGVEVHRALRPAELDQRDRRHVHRHVEHEVAAADVRIELAAIVVARQRHLHDLDAVLLGLLLAAIVGRDDGDALFRDADVAQDERQRALADAAEADEDDASWKLDVNLVVSSLTRANQGERVSTIIRCCHPMR